MSADILIDKFKAFIGGITEIPATEWPQLLVSLRVELLEPKQFLFRQGDQYRKISFVAKGLIHSFYTSDAGDLKTKNFSWEGRLIGPWTSMLMNSPAAFSAQALEKTYLITLEMDRLNELQKRHICWERMTRRCLEQILIRRERREYQSLVMNNEDRYRAFLQEFSGIAHRIPQHMIASYLGINQVSLSRAKRRMKHTSIDGPQ